MLRSLAGAGLAGLLTVSAAWANDAPDGRGGSASMAEPPACCAVGGTGAAGSANPPGPQGTAAQAGTGNATQASGAGGDFSAVPRMPANEVMGSVTGVDRSSNTVTLSDGQTLRLDSSTNVTKDGFGGSIKDIRRGDDVLASYSPTQCDTVQWVQALSPPGTYQPGP